MKEIKVRMKNLSSHYYLPALKFYFSPFSFLPLIEILLFLQQKEKHKGKNQIFMMINKL